MPGCNLPAVATGFQAGYADTWLNMLGVLSQSTQRANYNPDGSAQAPGTAVAREIGSDEYEWYIQDAWQLRPNLTITAGLRYSLYSPPYEVNGYQVAPTVSMGEWFDQRVATEVAASQNSRELSGYFQVVATAAPGRTLAEVDAAIRHEIGRVRADGPTRGEMERGVAQAEAHFISRLQTVGGFGGKSDQLNAYNVFCGDPAYFARDVARYREATQETVRAVAADVLRFDARVILSIVPHGRQELALAGSEPIVVS